MFDDEIEADESILMAVEKANGISGRGKTQSLDC